MNYDHNEGCMGYEDCQCFHVTMSKDRYRAMLQVIEAAREVIMPPSRVYLQAVRENLVMRPTVVQGAWHNLLSTLDTLEKTK